MEAMTGPAIGYTNMGDLLTELGQNYSDGITRRYRRLGDVCPGGQS